MQVNMLQKRQYYLFIKQTAAVIRELNFHKFMVHFSIMHSRYMVFIPAFQKNSGLKN